MQRYYCMMFNGWLLKVKSVAPAPTLNHCTLAPTKQNLLCGGRPARDFINQHPDILNNTNDNG